MAGFKFYHWTVSMDDGTRLSYEFEAHDEDPWTVVLRKFGKFMEANGHSGVSTRIEDMCEEYENELSTKIAGNEAFQELHG